MKELYTHTSIRHGYLNVLPSKNRERNFLPKRTVLGSRKKSSKKDLDVIEYPPSFFLSFSFELSDVYYERSLPKLWVGQLLMFLLLTRCESKIGTVGRGLKNSRFLHPCDRSFLFFLSLPFSVFVRPSQWIEVNRVLDYFAQLLWHAKQT